MGRPKLTEAELDLSFERRFRAGVDVRGPDECWEWQGARQPTGYGALGRGRHKVIATHRYALLSVSNPPPGKNVACHSCDNPPCCNPAHLFWGSDADNMADSVGKGRRHKDTCKRGHARTEENVRTYVDSRGYTVRDCRACDNLRSLQKRTERTTCKQGHPRTEENLGTYVDSRGVTKRYCRVCLHERQRVSSGAFG